MQSPAKWIYANVLVCKSASISPPAAVLAKPLLPYYASLAHLCALYLSNLHLSLPLSVWRPARRLSHGVESQHLVAGSDQSTPLETHQRQCAHIHTHTHTDRHRCHLTAGGQLAVRGREKRRAKEKAEREMDRTTEWELCSFWGKLQRGRDLQKCVCGHGTYLGRKMRRHLEKTSSMTTVPSLWPDFIQTYLPCTQGPPWTPDCPSAAEAAWGCGRHPATFSCKQSGPQWWPAGAGRHLLQYRWWQAESAGCLSRSARSPVSIQSPQHAPCRWIHTKKCYTHFFFSRLMSDTT